MNIFKSKLLWIAPIAILIILAIFSIGFYPAYNPQPKEMPIAIVNHDEGTSIQSKDINIGKNLEDKLKDSNSDEIKWINVDSEKEARKGLDEQKYFGAAIFEEDFSKNAMSKTQKIVMDTKKQEMEDKVKSGEIPAAQAKQMQQKMAQESSNQNITVKQAQFKTLTNSGANMQASQMSSNMLKGIGDNLNKQISKQSLDTLDQQNVQIDASDIKDITTPVNVINKKVNEVKDHQASGNAPFLMFMPVWISSIVASLLLFFAFRTSNNIEISQRIIASIGQMIVGVITAFVGGFGYVYFMSGVLGFDFPDINKIAIYISISILGFMGLILGVMTWLGMKSIPIFFIAMFFSMQLVTSPKQMLPKFYQDYIVDWNPFTHYAEYLRELLYMHQSLEMNSTMWMFVGFIIFGIISSILAAMIRKHSGKRSELPS
ncbi:ABC transporter permease [Staphylococcus equorum]|uniref:YhgE/Pip domain-containing protein n=1 Tax=Staphylococcus equorum TaxID=246432 RepID=UPI0003983044|nr:ABC transporter permease [Staphylococcus equorum]ANR68868.1 phage infection protein [Staphylococcus equorum]ERH36356.1 phage infection protein [Staphylococcus equorum UMC-CNS-924]KKI53229.1 Phage infection protein [Staphylococcus equorum subsp. equorum]MCE5046736.1 ABC transporter permease [Staphylococcus equorum]MDK9868295.1 ABC transporter permease [Staphylococcus equorum]